MSLDLEAIKSRADDVLALVAEAEALRSVNTELTQAVRLCDEEADGIQAELQAEIDRLRAVGSIRGGGRQCKECERLRMAEIRRQRARA